ncbi:DNA translocase FtsK, partial [Bacillus mycoides]|uniref:DNA translocase FtsK n=1 Tax=Bacillus mycoides TaxID=1405 RepID=UPI003CFD6080
HHIIVDEFPDYVVRPFKEFPAQSRKYKVILTIASQTLSQLALDFTEQYMFTLLGSFRNKMIFGDVTPYDAKIFSDMFGEKEEFKESESEQGISPMQENPVSRLGSTYQKTKEVVMSPGDIMAQGAFICAARIVQDNHVQPVQQITSNFVPKEEFAKAIIQVDEKLGQYWGNERLILIKESITKANPMKHVDAENMKTIEPLPPIQNNTMEQNNSLETDSEQQYIVSLDDYKDNKSEHETKLVEDIAISNTSIASEQQTNHNEEEEAALYEEIKNFVIEAQQVSPSLLQRKFRIGYMKTSRLIEKLEQNLVVSSYTGKEPRKVLISKDSSVPLPIEESDINSPVLFETKTDESIQQESAMPSEDKEAAQEETSFFKDVLYDEVVAFVKESRTASISALQDKFNIGYTRAARLLDALQRNGVLQDIETEQKLEFVTPAIQDTVPEETIEEVIKINSADIEDYHEIHMDVSELNKNLSISILEQDWNTDASIETELSVRTEPFQEELQEEVTTNKIEKESEINIEEDPTPVIETAALTEENKLDADVAKVYESISTTVYKNLEKNRLGNPKNNEEQREYSPMTYKERQELLKTQQKNKYSKTQPLSYRNEQPKKNASNVMSKELDEFFN